MDVFAKVSSVGNVFPAVFCLLPDPLIHPVPDETALQAPVSIEGFPVLLKSSRTVAHGVGILAEDVGFRIWLLGKFLEICDGGIHGAAHICYFYFPVAFVVDEACRIDLTSPLCHGLVVAAETGFVP